MKAGVREREKQRFEFKLYFFCSFFFKILISYNLSINNE